MKNTSTLTLAALRRRLVISCLSLALWLVGSFSLWAQTVYVTQEGGGQRTGADWANALPGADLQARLANATSGTEFRLAGGLYKPSSTGDRTVSFIIPSDVSVLGGYQGSGPDPDARVDFSQPSQPSSTTLSGDIDNDNLLDGDNTNTVVRFTRVSDQTRLDGVVITGGYATQIQLNPRAYNNQVAGGGIYNDGYLGLSSGSSSSPSIQNCLFILNYTSGKGGAVYNDGGLGGASPTFTNCGFVRNTAAEGGAMYNSGFRSKSSPRLTNCWFDNNSAARGGSLYNFSEGERSTFSYFGESQPVLINCSFTNNRASAQGGVMYNNTQGSGFTIARPFLTNCSLSDNSAPSGGAFYNVATPFTISFTNIRSGPTLYNSILWNNGGSNAVVNIKFNNTSGGSSTGEGYARFLACLIEPGVTSSESSDPPSQVITASPFVSEQSLQLRPCSPAIDAGINTYYTNQAGPATDLAGNGRVIPAQGTIDIGAYEYQDSANRPLIITQQPASQSTVMAGADIQVPVLFTGSATAYSWYQDGVLVSGQISATLTLTKLQPSQSGSYRLVATTPCQSLTTDAFSLLVSGPMDPPQGSIEYNKSTACAGEGGILTAQFRGGTAPYTYAWTASGSATLSNYPEVGLINLITPNAEVVTVAVLVTDANNLTATASLSLTVLAGPDASFNGLPTIVCPREFPITLTPTTAGGSFSGMGIEGNRFNPAQVIPGELYSINYTVFGQGCRSSTSQKVRVLDLPATPGLLTQSGQIYEGGQSKVNVPQYSGTVTLVASGCEGGQLIWTGPNSTTGIGNISVNTNNTGAFSYGVRCRVGDCFSDPARAEVWVWGNPLQIVAPLFDCATNQLTLRTTGGNGQPIEYYIPSVTQDWTTTNPVTLQAKDLQAGKLELSARQWNLVRNEYDQVKLDYQLPACSSSSLTRLWLINADTDQPIQALTPGTELNLASLPTRNLNIQAVTEPATVGSVVFSLSGQQTNRAVESVAPYALFGDHQGDYPGWTPALGAYSLTATPYSEAGGTGTAGTALTVGFTVVDPTSAQQVTRLWLINADTDQPIQALTTGTELNLASLPTRNLNIQAVTEPATVGSVVFSLSGQQTNRAVESVAPYALFGDHQGDYPGWTPALGAYSLTATPYTGAGGTGAMGTALTVSFTVVNQAAPLQVVAPLFDCATNQLTLRTTGGNGQPIEYHIPSVTQGWSSASVVLVEAKHFKKELKLTARQASSSGQGYDSYKLDYQLPTCPSARQGVSEEPVQALRVRVLGNPVVNSQLRVVVEGAQGQRLSFEVVDGSGRLLSTRSVREAGLQEPQELDVSACPAGVFVLRVSTAGQALTVKLIKP